MTVLHQKIDRSHGLVVAADHEMIVDWVHKTFGSVFDHAIANIRLAAADRFELIERHIEASLFRLLQQISDREVLVGKFVAQTKKSGFFYCLQKGRGTEMHFCRSGRCQLAHAEEADAAVFRLSVSAGDRIVLIDADARQTIGSVRFRQLALADANAEVVAGWLRQEQAHQGSQPVMVEVYDVPEGQSVPVSASSSYGFTSSDVDRWKSELVTLDKLLHETLRELKRVEMGQEREAIEARKNTIQKHILSREWWLVFAQKTGHTMGATRVSSAGLSRG